MSLQDTLTVMIIYGYIKFFFGATYPLFIFDCIY